MIIRTERTVANIIDMLSATSSRIEKERILETIMTKDDFLENEIFCKLAMKAFDTFETYGVKSVPNSSNAIGLHPEYALERVQALLDKLAARELTGHAARDAIKEEAELINNDDWNNFFKRVILKDLKCGVNVATWNKVAKKVNPKYTVGVFSCQLAKDGAKEKSITGTKLIEVKLDGVRVISIVDPDGTVSMYSRNGKPLTNFPKVADTLSKYASKSGARVFDGEIMSSSFQDLMKQVHRKEDVQTDDAVLYLFDTVTLKEFRAGISKTPQSVRSETLRSIIQDEDNVRVVDQIEVDLDTSEGQQMFRVINADAIAGGYEGIMIKDVDAPYETKRTKSWLKVKPVIEVTLTVVDVEQGTGKNEGRLGALVCEGEDDGVFIRVNVGSGLSDGDRDSIWLCRNEIIGQLVEIQADAVTQNQDGSHSLRFPRFKTFRGFNPNEKL